MERLPAILLILHKQAATEEAKQREDKAVVRRRCRKSIHSCASWNVGIVMAQKCQMESNTSATSGRRQGSLGSDDLTKGLGKDGPVVLSHVLGVSRMRAEIQVVHTAGVAALRLKKDVGS